MSDRDDFFVGYLPTPRGLKRLLLRTFITMLLGVLLLGAILAARQKDPGKGTWDLDHEHTLEGVLYASPYPMLLVNRDGAEQLVLLVGQGKVGAANSDIKKLDGRRVRASGFMLQREGRVLLEMNDVPQPLSNERHKALSFAPGHPITVRGEVIDPKCYSGAMKPGEGKTHKACAALCLRGGIPPMLVARHRDQLQFYLLTDEDGSALIGQRLDEVVALAGETVEVTGRESNAADLSNLSIHPGSFRRLRP
jgi:hypothetical protein